METQVVLHEHSLAPLFQDKWASTMITATRFSPDGSFLAAGSHDTSVDVWAQQQGRYQRLHRCRGHSSTITNMDWAADSSVLMSNDQSYEVRWTRLPTTDREQS